MSSYLAQLDEHQLARQIQYLLNEGFVPAIEYVRQPDPHDHYWGMWKLPLFQTRTAEDVLTEIQACKAAHPDCFIKVIGLRPPAADPGGQPGSAPAPARRRVKCQTLAAVLAVSPRADTR